MRKTIFLFLILPFLLAACTDKQPQISLEANNFNFGEVVNGDILTRDLLVRNDGDAPLIISAVTTSCGCTKASLDDDTISPGEQATLHIEFDSGAHGPELTGVLKRQIFITSNDIKNPEVIVEFESNILAPETP